MRGFTFIEGMIVAAIVGILLAIAIPAFQHWKSGETPVTTHPTPAGLVREFKLEDGTRCVAMKKNVTCDWRR